MDPKDRIIVALDISDHDQALSIVHTFKDHVHIFKVGAELFTSAGPRIVKELHLMGKKVFLDLKFHDIPQTVSNAVLAAARLGVFMMNVHTFGGYEMMSQAADRLKTFCLTSNTERPHLLGVTVLTSIDQKILRHELCIELRLHSQVKHLAGLAQRAGLDGVVASAEDLEMLRARFGKKFLIVTPGIRPSWASTGDQKRICSPKYAIRNGADYLVIGRPIIANEDPIGALRRIHDEIAEI